MPRPRKLPDGIKIRNGEYHADFYASGRRIRKRLSGDLDAATRILNEMKARADRADFGLLDNDYPLADLKTLYLADCRQTLKPSSYARSESCLKSILGRIGASRVNQVGAENVLLYRQERLNEGVSPRTVNLECGTLSAMLRWGAEKKLIGSNPLEGLKRVRHDHPKEGRPLTRTEVDRLLAASPAPWRDIWYAFLVTGLRKEELAALTFADVDREARELVIRQTKNHTGRRVPIDDRLWAVLETQRAGRDGRQPGIGKTLRITQRVRARFSRDHIFVTTQNTALTHRSGLYNAFIRCCKLAGIETRTLDADGRELAHVDVHSLRRTFATELIASGADPKSVQELLGHKTLDMTMRIYAKMNAGIKRQAIGRLSYGAGSLAPGHLLPYPGKVS